MAELLPDADHVVYAVGASSPARSHVDPAADIADVLPPLVRLLDLLRHHPQTSLVFLSSGGTVYGNAARSPVAETQRPRPVSSYGILKVMAEHYIDMHAQQHGLQASVLRIANVYGAGQPWANGQGIVARLMHCLHTGEPFPVFGDGGAIRDYVHVRDVADVVAHIAVQPDGHRVLNVGSGRGHTTLDVVRMVEEASARSVDVTFVPSRGFDVRSVVLDTRRLRQLLPFSPMSLRDGLQATWNETEAPASVAAIAPSPARSSLAFR